MLQNYKKEKSKKKILFLIHDLGQGGAEKVLVDLVNKLDHDIFDISVISLFGGGVNEQFLDKSISYRSIFAKEFRGNIYLFKLFSPTQIHSFIIKENYDIEVAYLEGPSARIISGCTNKNTFLIAWIHSVQETIQKTSRSFRNKREAMNCYNKFDQIVCVANAVKESFCKVLDYKKNVQVLYNTVNYDEIIEKSLENVDNFKDSSVVKLIAVGSLKPVKGFMRLLHIVNKLVKEKYPIHLYILGKGPQKKELEKYISKHNLLENVTLLGFQTNPYKYISKADMFICSSYSEGFSTAATEALIVGTPVITVDVSGMEELLGANNEYGVITENNEKALYDGIKVLIKNRELLEYYSRQASIRGTDFSSKKRIKEIEAFLSEVTLR